MTDTNKNIVIGVAVVIALVAIWYYMFGGETMMSPTQTPPPATQQTPAK